jgi:hypothetical protein
VIEPGLAGDCAPAPVDDDLAAHSQLRQAVVVAGREWTGALATESPLALQQRRLHAVEVEAHHEVVALHDGVIAIPVLANRPVVEPHVGESLACVRQIEPGPRRALGVPQAADGRIRDRRVPEQDLPRRKPARIRFAQARPHAKKRDLEADRLGVLVLDPTRHVPPLDAEIGMRALVARELQLDTGRDLGIHGLGRRRQRRAEQQ